jgi:hypothetical protein
MPNPYDASAPSFVPPAVGAPPAGAPAATYTPQPSPYGAPPTSYAPTTAPGYQGYQPPAAAAPTYRQGQWRPSTRLGAVEASTEDSTTRDESTNSDDAVTAQNAADEEDANMAHTADARVPGVQAASFRDPRGLDELGTGQLETSQLDTRQVVAEDLGTVEPYDLDAALAARQPTSWADAAADNVEQHYNDEQHYNAEQHYADQDYDARARETTGEVEQETDAIDQRQFTRRWKAAEVEPEHVETNGNGQLASWTSPAVEHSNGAGASVHITSTGSSPTVRPTGENAEYGHDREYRRLQGVLEHSRISGRWKLRYIPVDGETDDYGGSVRLQATGTLDSFQHGEAVTIEGHIEAADTERGVYAPKYLIESIRRQGA